MKKLIYNGLLFIIIIASLISLFDHTQSYYYGNSEFSAKMQILKDDYNTFFFGSSRVNTQIDPQIFDAVTSEMNIKSFNLGSNGCFNPESYYLAENFIHSQVKEEETKYVFIELQKLSDIYPKNSLKIRGYYWNNISEMFFIFSYLKESETTAMSKKMKIGTKYSISYLFKKFDISRLSLLFEDNPSKGIDLPNGFNPFTKRNEKVLLSSDMNLDALLNMNEKIQKYTHFNTPHINRLNNLIILGKNKNIEVYFILTPKWNDYNFAIEIINGLDSIRVINLTQTENTPLYYLPKYSFDEAHLNFEGSKIFTKELADEFLKKVDSE